MKLIIASALILVLTAILVVGCNGDNGNPPDTSTPVLTPAATASPGPAATVPSSATPAATPAPTSSAVIEAWAVHYNSPRGGADWPFDIAIDGSHSIYVTGKSYSRGSYDYSYATVKYDSDGNELWDARYDGPGGDDDQALAMAIDGSGNVYVTGKSYNGPHEDYAYATVKYDTDGNELWVARYDGAGSVDDIARAIVVDGLGNVYVTGSSGGDYATVKYDSEGKQLWAAGYDGFTESEDGAVAIGLDSASNVYVTGTSWNDFVTIKYDGEGNELWIARFDKWGDDDVARAMVVDSLGNTYVTGKVFDASRYIYEYATVKYDTDGKLAWSKGCSGPYCGSGEPFDIAIDTFGNVYVTGRSYSNQLLSYGYTTVKYDSSGKQQWIARYDGMANGRGNPYAIVVDAQGNVYVAGESYIGQGVNYTYATVKYDKDGNELWVALYNSYGGGWNQAVALAVDELGNAYVTGKADGGAANRDYATIKYVSRYTGP
jgi:hypothetical protein